MRPHAERVAMSLCSEGHHVFVIKDWQQPHALVQYGYLRVDLVCSQCRVPGRRVLYRRLWDAMAPGERKVAAYAGTVVR